MSMKGEICPCFQRLVAACHASLTHLGNEGEGKALLGRGTDVPPKADSRGFASVIVTAGIRKPSAAKFHTCLSLSHGEQ